MATLADNKQGRFNYEILDEIEAGIVLTGQEVKSAKLGHISMKGSFVSLKNGSAMIKNLHISPYQKASIGMKSYNPTRERQLLLKKSEMVNLMAKTSGKGLTIIPVSVYTTRRLVKVKIALARGKKQFDKREAIKRKDIKRHFAAAMRHK